MDLSGRLAGWLWLVGVVSALAWIGNLAAGATPKDMKTSKDGKGL